MKRRWEQFWKERGIRLRDPRILLAILLAYGFTRTSGGPFPHLLLYTLTSLGLIAALWAVYAAKTLRVAYDTPAKHLTRGDDLPVTLLIYNEGLLPALRLIIRDGSQPDRTHYTQLGGLSSLRLQYNVPQLKRGRYRPGPVIMGIGDPFGFFEIEKTFTSKQPITVYPPVHHWSLQLPLAQSFGHTRTRRRTTSDPSGLVGIRQFRAGDNTKHIDWKASARLRELQVKEFELEAGGLLSLYVNLTATDYDSDEQVERAIDATAAVAIQALRQGFELRMFAQGQASYYLPPTRGDMGVRGVLELLVDMQVTSASTFARTLHDDLRHAPPEASLVVVAPVLDARASELVRQIARRGRPLLLVRVGDDVDDGMRWDNLAIYQVDESLKPALKWKGGLIHASSPY